eukprot:CAMPEP_0114274626 /NCGR_PEP_ID=MMETSP0058-20121206/29865_1 /TAXON_ID=36894 /ORGANISM="Pyramimonas parkeae, CCMP726" /LENGTH=168 /DNA_ID=CAMNT_0001394429 /DNA_START=554 /DNA_END=1056 /DNA_ORIENTATION=-
MALLFHDSARFARPAQTRVPAVAALVAPVRHASSARLGFSSLRGHQALGLIDLHGGGDLARLGHHHGNAASQLCLMHALARHRRLQLLLRLEVKQLLRLLAQRLLGVHVVLRRRLQLSGVGADVDVLLLEPQKRLVHRVPPAAEPRAHSTVLGGGARVHSPAALAHSG